ncbi:nonstructural protein [Human astrovirus 6]|uniref:Nonstructural protein n=1 Tax=Human astrovirus-6 TaxID=37130 RepID=D9J0B0_HASV6|nr:nonstructural protein [Human astrovirus 6]
MALGEPYYSSKPDKDFNFGSTMARRHVTPSMVEKLPKFVRNSPQAYDWIVRGLIFPTTGKSYFQRVVVVTGGLEDGTYGSFAFDGKEWVEIYPIEHLNLMASLKLIHKSNALQERLRHSQEEKATLALDVQFLQHENVRLKELIPKPKPRVIQMKWVILGAVLTFLSLIPGGYAHSHQNKTIFTDMLAACKYSTETLTENLDLRIKIALANITITDKLDAMKQIFNFAFVPRVHWLRTAFHYIHYYEMWNIFMFVLAVSTVMKSTRPGTDLITLATSHLSGFRMAVLPTIPFHTTLTLWVMNILMLVYFLDNLLAITLALLAPILGIVFLCFMEDSNYVNQVRGLIATAILIAGGHACLTLTGTTTSLFVVILTCRFIRMATVFVGARFEIRDANGKVVATVPTRIRNAAFDFFQKLKQSGVRVGVNDFVVIKPGALCIIDTPEGKGTGFFSGNDIITAAHVVGNNTFVNICYEGLMYEAKVRYMPEKDIAFITCPGDLHPTTRLKLAKNPDYSSVTVMAYVNEDLVVSTATAMVHGNTLSYAVRTQDGMSGAPVCDKYGRVLAVHQTNTGYTGGAVVIDPADFHPVKAPSQIEQLKEEIERLKAQLNATTEVAPDPTEPQPVATLEQKNVSDNDVVDLVRIAMEREMKVLRDEINKVLEPFIQKKKGKTKHGRGRVRRNLRKGVKLLTEEEYRELLEKGLDRETFLDLIDRIIGERAGYPDYDDDEYYDDDDDGWGLVGDDVEFDYTEVINFDQHRKKPTPAPRTIKPKLAPAPAIEAQPLDLTCKQRVQPEPEQQSEPTKTQKNKPQPYSQTYGKAPIWESYDFDWDEDDARYILPAPHRLTKADEIVLGSKIVKLRTIIETAIKTQNYSALPEAVFELDKAAYEAGLEGFLQRVKSKNKAPKNYKGPQKTKGPKTITH